jgi:hypothetical protein
VEWLDASKGSWQWTKTGGITAGTLGKQILSALRENYSQDPWLILDNGLICLFEIVVPDGFSGGGAYTTAPAAILYPDEHPDASPGNFDAAGSPPRLARAEEAMSC